MEKNITTCSKCQEKKLRILAGKYPNGDKKYTDETNAYWNGNSCPACNRSRVKRSMRAMRKADKQGKTISYEQLYK